MQVDIISTDVASWTRLVNSSKNNTGTHDHAEDDVRSVSKVSNKLQITYVKVEMCET